MKEDRCKNLVAHGFHFFRCKRKASIDGFCKQHHPNSYKKRREEAEKKYEEKMKNSPWYKFGKALERIKELEAEIAELKNKLSQ